MYTRVCKSCLIAKTLKLNEHTSSTDSKTNIDEQAGEEVKKVEQLNAENKPDLVKLPDALKNGGPPITMPVSLFKFENAATVTSLADKIKENDEKKLYHGVCCGLNETDDTFISDLVGILNLLV